MTTRTTTRIPTNDQLTPIQRARLRTILTEILVQSGPDVVTPDGWRTWSQHLIQECRVTAVLQLLDEDEQRTTRMTH